MGAELDENNPKWKAFGHAGLPLVNLGFCLASEVLIMKEGERMVNISLTVNNLPTNANNERLINNLFEVSITGEKGWIGPKSITPVITSNDNVTYTISFSYLVGKDEPAVVAYNAAVHGADFDTVRPIIQVLINKEKADFGYNDLSAAEITDATIEVDVKDIKSLQLENDYGSLNAKKAFFPFGSSPETNANFYIGSDEAFSKRLKKFSVDVNWKNIPDSSLVNYFEGYPGSNNNSDFTASASFKDGYHWEEKAAPVNLFNGSNAQLATSWVFQNAAFPVKFPVIKIPYLKPISYVAKNQTLQQKISVNISQQVPAFTSLQSKLLLTGVTLSVLYKPMLLSILNTYKDIRKGLLSIRLKHSFLFKEYRDLYTSEVFRVSKKGGDIKLPSEPFAPEILSIALNYTATTAKIAFTGTNLNDYLDEEIEFFHYAAFGKMREHAYARSQQTFLSTNSVKLLPEYRSEGEFFIGLSDLNASESLCLLFQVAEGSANPERSKAIVDWSVLCDNYWKSLSKDDFVFDTTNDLLSSGVIKLVIPKEATTGNTLMPGGLIWLKAAIRKETDAVCSLLDVMANAAISVFSDQDNDPFHFNQSTPANTINKLLNNPAGIKTVKQPFVSFGGRARESDQAYYVRVSERLRHKQRNISLWDFERMILQNFPKIHKVKCINHANENSFYTPGHTLIVVVPDLSNSNAVDPLQPKVDKNTLDEISEFLAAHSSSWVEHHVTNPFYEKVKVAVKIKLKRGFEFNYYQKVINQELQQFLSPWINNSGNDIHFGGKVTQSMIVQFLERLPYVDYLSDLSIFQHKSTQSSSRIINTSLIKPVFRIISRPVVFAEASNPAAILVSDSHHDIFNE
jgi:hypothetical protein